MEMGVEMGIIRLKRQFLIRKSATHVWFHRTDAKFKTNSAEKFLTLSAGH